MANKKCPKCGKLKPLNEFYVHRYNNGHTYYQGYCKKCQATAYKEWNIDYRKYCSAHPLYKAAKLLPDTDTLRRTVLNKFNAEVKYAG